MEIQTRFATPDDAATIHQFICELAAYEKAPDAVRTTVALLRSQLESTRPPFECLLAEDHREPLGLALFFHNYSTWLGSPGIYLEDLFVPPRHRRRGVGRKLMRRLAALAVERGCARMEWAVLHWNQLAFDFYHDISARRLDDWVLCRLTGETLEELARS